MPQSDIKAFQDLFQIAVKLQPLFFFGRNVSHLRLGASRVFGRLRHQLNLARHNRAQTFYITEVLTWIFAAYAIESGQTSETY
ncbi:MAG: hypothetical protein FD163_357 [Hyphomonadaceae bacterium]|nr:MAG: hypothetical protein FD128_101 [Hyphomonadaceae bacterium]KAF0187082.1 MAG: hypothetical protein FD163_357 [Hyphomonadaceae bacterium]